MAAEVVLLFLLLGLAFPLALYALVRSEHDERETMDWDSAERAARRDASESGPPREATASDDDREDVGWDSDDQ